MLPEQVDPDVPGASAIKAIHQSTWRIAEQVNALRNLILGGPLNFSDDEDLEPTMSVHGMLAEMEDYFGEDL